MKIKTGLMALLPILVGSYIMDASAVGKSYDFTAGSPGSGQWDLTLSGNGNHYYIPIFNEFNPAENFIAANQTIAGGFSYNTDAPARSSTETYAFYYEDTFLSVQLASENEQLGHFDLIEPYATTQNHANNQHFGVRGFRGTAPPITLTGDGCNDDFFCGGGFNLQQGLPIEEMKADNPGLFDKITDVGVEIFSFGSGMYNLETVGFSLSSNTEPTLFPTDNSLPDHLPPLAGLRSDSLNIEFETDGGVELEVVGIAGDFDSQQEEIEQQQAFEEFFYNLYPDLQLIVHYDVTDLIELPEGATPNNPILPNPEPTPEGGFEFTFEVTGDEFTFVDPEVAVGYDYEVLEGSYFLAVLLPDGIGDDLYDLWLFDEALGEFVDSGEDLTGGVAYLFGEEGLSLFRILGIETDENLDPDDPLAFVTGLKFLTEGEVSISQTPITQTVVPIPPSIVLLISGVAGLFVHRRKV